LKSCSPGYEDQITKAFGRSVENWEKIKLSRRRELKVMKWWWYRETEAEFAERVSTPGLCLSLLGGIFLVNALTRGCRCLGKGECMALG
jgi:hypothetical protein